MLAKAEHARVIDRERRFSEIVNIACAGTTTWYGFACRAVEALEEYSDGREVRVERTSTALLGRPAPRPKNSTLSLARLADEWGVHAPQWEKACDLVVAEVMQSARLT
jgi:dTDP-4-dehydrorhamnose reductase